MSGVGDALRRAVAGDVWEIGDDGYDSARRVWNGAVDRRPAVVVRCARTDDVAPALLTAREYGLPVTVRAGGHDWAGRAVRDGAVTLDLSALRGVIVSDRSAEIQGGAHVGDLAGAAHAHGLGTATGVVADVGLLGLTMSGGYGGLMGQFGLALDNLEAAQVVLADGRTVSTDDEPDLFWALRGGGGNFGVVTAARYRLHDLGPVHGGMLMYPGAEAAQVLKGYRDVTADAPDELTVMAGLVTGPTGEPVVFLAPTWSGDPALGAAALAPLTRLGTLMVDGVTQLPYPELLHLFDQGISSENGYALDTRWLPALGDEHIEALIAAARTATSPHFLLALHHFHGAATRFGIAATAFAQRGEHLMAEVIAAWTPGDDRPEHRAWVAEVSSSLMIDALPGGYPNILGPDETERTRLGYGANAERLTAIKERYDPDHVFRGIGAI